MEKLFTISYICNFPVLHDEKHYGAMLHSGLEAITGAEAKYLFFWSAGSSEAISFTTKSITSFQALKQKTDEI